MKIWNLKSGGPGAYTIAADARCTPTIYANDHIWELKQGGGEPPALAIQTTFGLRARNFRLFPRFVEGDNAIIDPILFYSPPAVRRLYPNFLQVTFSPFKGIDVIIDYWVPESNILAGRIQVTNSRLTTRKIRVQWAAILNPIDEGHRMAHQGLEATTILSGQTAGLFPVIFMTGGPEISAGPYPALSLEMNLDPGNSRELTWGHAALETQAYSFIKARATATRSWDAEIARLEVLNQSVLDVQTGDPDWNAAFMLAQNYAFGFMVGPTEHLPNISNVSCRQPDQGHSSLGNGTDYDHLWDGQIPLDVNYLNSFLLPSAPHLARGLLENFLETQTKSGFIDFKPGLGGQRYHMLATPILVEMAWKIYEATEDLSFLENVFPKLLNFVRAWFADTQDRDGDGLPEWTHPLQLGFEDHPVFSQFYPGSQGADISKIESPSLCSFLYNEIQHLISIAQITHQANPLSALEAMAENLKSAIKASWDETDFTYRHWDRESHFSPSGEFLGQRMGSGEIHINRQFPMPIRLSVRVSAAKDLPRTIRVFIHGTGPYGNYRIERLEVEQFHWHIDRGSGSSERIYTTIENIEVIGVANEDQISVEVIDFSVIDHTLLLPLWAGIPDETRAHDLVTNTVLNPEKFWKTFGILACPSETKPDGHSGFSVHMIWNTLIGEGLLKYGFRKETAELVTRLMQAVILNLKKNQSFYNYYHPDSGHGWGERNTIGGLAPIKLFLDTLGVRVISPTKVLVQGKNPFPWPVTIRFRGLIVNREAHTTRITFPGGQSAIVKSEDPRIITLEGIT